MFATMHVASAGKNLQRTDQIEDFGARSGDEHNPSGRYIRAAIIAIRHLFNFSTINAQGDDYFADIFLSEALNFSGPASNVFLS